MMSSSALIPPISYLNATGPVTVNPLRGLRGKARREPPQAMLRSAQIPSPVYNTSAAPSFADTMVGSNNLTGVEVFEGGGGNDFIDGRGGFDRAAYEFRIDDNVTSGITVNLAAGTVIRSCRRYSIGTDTLRSIESVRGTHFADALTPLALPRPASMPAAPESTAMAQH